MKQYFLNRTVEQYRNHLPAVSFSLQELKRELELSVVVFRELELEL